MTRLDPLADALSLIQSKEFVGSNEAIIAPASKQIASTLRVMQQEGYIGEFEFIDDGGPGKFKVQLLGRINKCKVIKPRYSVGFKDLEEWEKRYLPAKEFGILVMTTNLGFITHKEAAQQKIGGKLVAVIY